MIHRARAFALGVLVAIVGQAAIAAAVIVSGVVDVAATRKRPAVDRVLAYTSTRSIAHHAPKERNPFAGDSAAVKRGLEHYRDDCLACHGGPGAHPHEFSAGLHPRPPDLASPEVQSFTDGMLYATIAGGIGSTGMPAFASTHSPQDIWSIVAFVRHLPSLTEQERKELGSEGGKEEIPSSPSGAQPAAKGEAPSGATPAPGRHLRTIRITGFKFVPDSAEVDAGDIVEWKNEDFVAHTATADDHSFDTGQIDGGSSKRVAVRTKGRFAYTCRYHPEMKGTLVVK